MRSCKLEKLKLCKVTVALALPVMLAAAFSGQAYADEKVFVEQPVGVIVHENGPLPREWEITGGADPDYSDWDLLLYLDQNTTWGSQIRGKGTKSSVYAKINTMGTFARLYTEGWNKDCTSHANCTWGGEANLYRTGKYEIYNNIKENWWWNAQITSWRDYGSGTPITGAWSPDYMEEAGVSVLNP